MTVGYSLQVAVGDACPSGQFSESGQCCSLCPAGFGAVAECRKADTKCAPCPQGKKLRISGFSVNAAFVLLAFSLSLTSVQDAGRFTGIVSDRCNRSMKPRIRLTLCFPGTFSSSEGLGPCQPCAKCPRSVPTLASCTATENTQCECDSGFFFWGAYGACAPCSKCTRGEGVTRECGPKGNTLCQICGPGTFSEELRSTKPCQVCTKCSDSEVEIRACLPNSDTLCMGE